LTLSPRRGDPTGLSSELKASASSNPKAQRAAQLGAGQDPHLREQIHPIGGEEPLVRQHLDIQPDSWQRPEVGAVSELAAMRPIEHRVPRLVEARD
jgi:hypothetical protein